MRKRIVTLIATTERGWECAIVEQAGDAWAVVWDGLSTHEGPVVGSYDEAFHGVACLVSKLEGYGAVARAVTGTAGVN